MPTRVVGMEKTNDEVMKVDWELLHFYISPDHNYFGHYGGPAGQTPMLEVDALHCLAGRGIEGDRFCDFKKNYKGQITFFEEETYLALRAQFDVRDVSPAVFRRNVITRGVHLNDWIGREFEIQGIRFEGTEESKPCFWMNEAVGPGAEAAMKGRGGLRARILNSGRLRPARFSGACRPGASVITRA